MFQHLLVPTDGSSLSRSTAIEAARFAKAIGAKITGFHAMPALRLLWVHPGLPTDTRADFERRARADADQALDDIQEAARAQGVVCDTVMATSDRPHEAILRAAQDRGCDLIFMASYGRRGLEAMLIGSETQKVLTHSKVPVMVWRGHPD